MKKIPIIRRNYLSDNAFVSSIVGSTLPGSKKLQFPFEIPVINTSNDVTISPGVKTALIATTSILAFGMIGSAILKRSTK